jgi:DNA helicase IV
LPNNCPKRQFFFISMDNENKKDVYEKAQARVFKVVEKIKTTLANTRVKVGNIKSRISRSKNSDRIIEVKVLEHSEQRLFELEHLRSSPYFIRCEVDFKGKSEEMFFSKFNYSEENIYSWTSPASKIRYEAPGKVEYKLPGGEIRQGSLIAKDQFMIVGGKIVFMAAEKLGSPRKLIHQENLARQKEDFILPEIVEQMEKKQDEVIRADWRGSYLISGPAGSGKTTLALHRAAYLALSPDTAERFPGSNIIVFVHDNSTKKYFSELLPRLGINNAQITIFSDWAKDILGLPEYEYAYRYGKNERDKDEFEFLKNKALNNFSGQANDPMNLVKIYSAYFNQDQNNKFLLQLQKKILDRFDFAILLKSFIRSHGAIKKPQTYIAVDKRGRETIKREPRPLKYSLIIIDEAENYLKDEINIIKSCANENKAVLYVGDLAQQTKLFTIKNWQEASEDFAGERKVELFKVYRNTRQILYYIKSRGYDVSMPLDIKSGAPVIDVSLDFEAEKAYIDKLINQKKDLLIGIIHYDQEYLKIYKEKYDKDKNIYVMSINEAQGVEFDVVIFLKKNKRMTVNASSVLNLIKKKCGCLRI